MESREKKEKEHRSKRKKKEFLLAGCIFLVGMLVIGLIVKFAVLDSTNHKNMKKDTEVSSSQSSSKSGDKSESTESKFLKSVDFKNTQLQLVGPDHKLENQINEETDLESIGNFRVNKLALPHYQELAQAAQLAGYPLVIISAYRSVAYQKQVLDGGIQQRMNAGMNYDDALADAKRVMTVPGFSEHHTGLAMDVVDQSWANSYSPEILHENFGATEGAKWLAENAATYGFIVRYPKGKESITKIDYEPWHIRYVGKENAEYMYKHQLTLEEFLSKVEEVQNKK